MATIRQLMIISVIFFIAIFVSNASAEDMVEPSGNQINSTITRSLNDIDLLLAGDLKSIVLFNDVNSAIKKVKKGIIESVGKAEDGSKQIIISTHKTSSKEFKNNCNFVQITVYLGSMREALVNLKKCADGCNESKLSRIKYRLFHNYSDLQSKVGICRNYFSNGGSSM